jgi:hypothetical protein
LSGPGRSHTDIGEGRNMEDLLVDSNEARHYRVQTFDELQSVFTSNLYDFSDFQDYESRQLNEDIHHNLETSVVFFL